MFVRIGIVAGIIGVCTKTLRRWEQRGIIMVDIIKELAISYNPILADLISETLVYSMKTTLWDM